MVNPDKTSIVEPRSDIANRNGFPAGFSTVAPILFLCLFLANCASPTGVKFAAVSGNIPPPEQVLVATSRAPNGKADYSGERSNILHLASYHISIPPNHKVGQIEWPQGKPDPGKHFAVASAETIRTDASFKAELNRRLAATHSKHPHQTSEAVLFVHGYNTDFSESLYRTAQMKRDFGMPMPMTLFSWPSAGKPELYIYDRDSVKASRDQLAHVINLLIASNAKQVTLVAHSLGTELLMETLRQMALSHGGRLNSKIKTVVLISPDLDIDVFNSELQSIRALPQNFLIFVSARDQALQLSTFLAGDNSRVGNNIDERLIKREGITVIDVSEFDGGDSLNHMTAITSPGLVSVLSRIAHGDQRDALLRQKKKVSLGKAVVKTATLPLALVMKTTKAIFDE